MQIVPLTFEGHAAVDVEYLSFLFSHDYIVECFYYGVQLACVCDVLSECWC